MNIDLYTYELIRRRAAYPILLKYRVNRYELWMLCQMVGFLKNRNRVIVSQISFFRQVSGNHIEKKKMSGYYQGLITRQLIGSFEWAGKAGSESFGISDLGARVLREYEEQIKRLCEMLKPAREVSILTFTEGTQRDNYYRKSA